MVTGWSKLIYYRGQRSERGGVSFFGGVLLLYPTIKKNMTRVKGEQCRDKTMGVVNPIKHSLLNKLYF
jgi:hypothetical protein